MADQTARADFASVPGNDELKRRLARSIRENTLGHAYVLEGSGIILPFAKEIAKAVLCRGNGTIPCGECDACRKIDAGTHPDVTFISRGDRASIGVDTIRSVRAEAYIIPSEAERKIYVIEDADTMTAEAQNAFLLTLEEPPEYVLYLLLCRNSDNLLETVRSRAPSLRCRPCTPDELGEYVLRTVGAKARTLRSRDPSAWEELILISAGDPALASSMLENGELAKKIETKRQALSLLLGALSRDDDTVVTVSGMKKLRRDDALELITCMRGALRDMLISKKTSTAGTCFFPSADDAVNAAQSYPARRLAIALDAVSECGALIERNAAITTSLLSMTIKIRNSQ